MSHDESHQLVYGVPRTGVLRTPQARGGGPGATCRAYYENGGRGGLETGEDKQAQREAGSAHRTAITNRVI